MVLWPIRARVLFELFYNGICKRGITCNINMKSLHFFVTNNAYPKRVQAKVINSWKPTTQQGELSEHDGTHLMHFVAIGVVFGRLV